MSIVHLQFALCQLILVYFTRTDAVVGGVVAELGELPYTVIIRFTKDEGLQCGGSIIGENWVLTAASCIMPKIEAMEIVVGTNNLKQWGFKYQIIKRIPHEKFDNKTRANNIGLLKVDTIEFTTNVNKVDLPTGSLTRKANQLLTFGGWGGLDKVGKIKPDLLQKIKLREISNEICKIRMKGMVVGKKPTITVNDLCILNTIGEGPCWRDAGGGLVDADSNQIVAVYNSNPYKFCAAGVPARATRVENYLDWIHNKMINEMKDN